jgi:hypothetical protein
MLRLKIGLVAVGLVAILAASAAPAFALFESESGKLSGVVANSEITSGGEFVYESGNPTAVKCPTKSPTIEWSLPATKSTIQKYLIKWGTECKVEVGSSKFPAVISNSELQVKSAESGKATYTQLKGSNLNETVVKVESELCVIKVPVAGNNELKKTEQSSPSLTSFEESVLVNVTGITSNEKSKGVGCTLKTASTSGELKGVAFKLKGQGQR